MENVFRHKNLFDFWPLWRFIHWSDQQTRILRNTWNERQQIYNLACSSVCGLRGLKVKNIGKYSVSNIQISNNLFLFFFFFFLHFLLAMPTFNLLLFFFFWAACDTQLSRIFEHIKYHFWINVKDYIFRYYDFLWKRRTFTHFNYCVISMCETLAAFVVSFIMIHKRPTVTLRQFCKQATILFY